MATDDLPAPSPSGSETTGPNPGPRYELHVSGRLGPRSAVWFDGFEITAEPDGTTLLGGPVVDQAALHGVLERLRDLGIPLLSITQTAPSTRPLPHGTNRSHPGANP